MIKINLKNTKTSAGYVSGEKTYNMSTGVTSASSISSVAGYLKKTSSEVDATIFFKIILKSVFILSIPLGLKIYELQTIFGLEKQKKVVEASLSSKKRELAGLQTKMDSFGYLEKESKEYKSKKSFLKELAKSRLTIPKFMDNIQSVIPDSIWLTRVQLSLKEEDSDVIIEGESLNEENVNLFLQSLKGIIQGNSIQFNTQDMASKGDLVRVKFNIKGVL